MQNPPRGDDRRRELERRAAQGDPDAQRELDVIAERTRPRRWLEGFPVAQRTLPRFAPSASDLAAMPTLLSASGSELKYDDGRWRLWLRPDRRHPRFGPHVIVDRRTRDGWVQWSDDDVFEVDSFVLEFTNERRMHDAYETPIRRALIRAYLQGSYDPNEALREWRRATGAYARQFGYARDDYEEQRLGTYRVRPVILDAAAEELAQRFEEWARSGEYERLAEEVARSLGRSR
jgi:hypothetical protein